MDSVHPFLRGVARLRGAMPGPADPAASLPAEAAVPRQGTPTAVPVPYGITHRCIPYGIPVLKAGAAGEHGWAPSHTRGGLQYPVQRGPAALWDVGPLSQQQPQLLPPARRAVPLPFPAAGIAERCNCLDSLRDRSKRG